MKRATRVTGSSVSDFVDSLTAHEGLVDHLCLHPISALEGMGGELHGVARSVCPVGCLACCADALRPSELPGRVALLDPPTLRKFLAVADALIRRKAHVISTGRLNLFSGSNELDHPHCIELRKILSLFLLRHYGVPLGYMSSDIAFHVSGSRNFRANLISILELPTLWDNICFSIDEQIPTRSRADYDHYLENVAFVWSQIKSALNRELAHAKPSRARGPRVLLNFLVPACGDAFRQDHLNLYTGGPPRATSHKELLRRYVHPFVGDLCVTDKSIPYNHVFTTGIGTLSELPRSEVYVSFSNYMVTQRGRRFLSQSRNQTMPRRAIRTKLIPIGDNLLRIKACFASTHASEDEIPVHASERPPWFDILDHITFDVSTLAMWSPVK